MPIRVVGSVIERDDRLLQHAADLAGRPLEWTWPGDAPEARMAAESEVVEVKLH